MRPHGRHAIVAPQNPEAFAQCDRCGFWYNRSQLMWQMEWSGTHLYNLGILVCQPCIDVPQEQLRTIILPPDPPPVINARPPNFTFEEEGPVQSTMAVKALTGSNLLPVVSVAGFALENIIWIQLNNATFQQVTIIGIDALNNVLEIDAPLTGVAPYTGSITVADTTVPPTPPTPPITAPSATFGGTGLLRVTTQQLYAALAAFGGVGSLSALSFVTTHGTAVFGGAGSLSATPLSNLPPSAAIFSGNGTLLALVTKATPGSAVFGGTGSLLSSASRATLGLATFTGAGSLSATPSPAVPFATFDNATVGGATSLSGGNLVATTTNVGIDGYSGARGTRSHSTGKFYHEITVTQAADLAFGSFTVGYGNASAPTQTNNGSIPNPGFDASLSVIVAESGWWLTSFNSNNAALPVNTGDVMGLAIDLDSRLCWIRNITQNPAIWNISGDPVAETGGENMAVITGAIFPMWWGYTEAPDGGGIDIATVNFGASPYAATPPSGYLNW